MTPEELEDRLRRLGANWPVPSVVDDVMARIVSQSEPQARPVSWLRRRVATLVAVAATFAVAVGAWLYLLAAPATLQARMRRSLDLAQSAHLRISSVNEQGPRQQGEVWFERGHGFRAELADEVILDDGYHQWTWRQGPGVSEPLVVRRTSHHAADMIAGIFRFGAAAATGARSPEDDRVLHGQACRAFVVTPPQSDVISEQSPLRFLVLLDADERIVHLEEQTQLDGHWQSRREVSVNFDGPIPADKRAFRPPAGWQVIDADRALEERFPLDKALASGQTDGLLFAVHELQRGPDEMIYVVSSVRGTPEYLKNHPPQRRQVNPQVSRIDVAEQCAAASTDLDCNRAVLASAEAEGVHYLWWLAVRRRYFTMEDGKRTSLGETPSLEIQPGRVRIPLQAVQRGLPGLGNWVRINLEMPLATDHPVQPLTRLAARARHDVLLIRQVPGVRPRLLGWARDEEMRHTLPEPDQITDQEFANQIGRQLDWLHSHDKVIPSGTDRVRPAKTAAAPAR